MEAEGAAMVMAAAGGSGEAFPARFGSFIGAPAEEFDAPAFGISKAEAVLMGEVAELVLLRTNLKIVQNVFSLTLAA